MNAQQLKNSILQEAIEGRLVPQDPNDEPASVLLDKIRKEKAKLVKEGKINKKYLEESPIPKEDIPFIIPNGWEWVRLSFISLDSADGPFGSNLKSEHYTLKKEVRVIQLSNIGEDGWRDENVKYTTFSHLPTISRSEAFPDDIIIAKMMPAGRAIICPYGDKKYVLSSDAVRFDFSKLLYRKYLYYAINSQVFKDQVYGEVQGITRVRTSLGKLRTYIIPLPPLAEQKRIVEEIEELLPKVEEYGKAQEALDKLNEELPERLKKSILQEAIEGRLVPQDPNDEPASVLLEKIRKEKARLVKEGKLKKKDLEELPISEDEKPFEIPESWEWVRLISISKAIHYGYTASASLSGNAKLLRITDIQNDKVNWHTVPFCTIKEKDLESYQLHNRDILIARTGGTVGKTYIVRELNDISVFASYLIRAIPLDTVNEEYIKLFMDTPYYWTQLTESTSGTGQPNVNGQSLSKLIIPLPPLAEQKRIVAKIEQLLGEIDKMKV